MCTALMVDSSTSNKRHHHIHISTINEKVKWLSVQLLKVKKRFRSPPGSSWPPRHCTNCTICNPLLCHCFGISPSQLWFNKQVNVNKSSAKSLRKSESLPLMAENALVCCVCSLCNVNCRQVQLLNRGYATSTPRQFLDTSVPSPNLILTLTLLSVLIPLQLPAS